MRWSHVIPWLTIAAGLTVAAAAPACRSVRFRVGGTTAQNRNLTGVTLDDLSALQQAVIADEFPRITISGKQTLAGTFCEPSVRNSNNGRLQVFFHAFNTNRDSWSALGGTELGYTAYKPERYSWVQYATGKGFATLAIDRLGNGLSSHPDPILVTQGPYEDELYHDLAQQIRSGRTNSLPRIYSDLIWVGNSFGSQLGSTSAQKYPQDWNAYVLTGFTKVIQPSIIGLPFTAPLPAALVDPARFGGLDPGYLTGSIDPAIIDAFFGIPENVDYDTGVTGRLVAAKDVASIGQTISTQSPSQMGVSPDYTGRVFVITGERDQLFCGLGSSVYGARRCGNLPRDTGSLFPSAEYNYMNVDRAGNFVQLHESAPTVLDVAHRFLAGERFQVGPSA